MQKQLREFWEDLKSVSLPDLLFLVAFAGMVMAITYHFAQTEWPNGDFKKMMVEVR